MDNLVVVKVVETVVTVYTVKGDFCGEQAQQLVESVHNRAENEDVRDSEKVTRVDSKSTFKSHVEYQLTKDRPTDDPSKHGVKQHRR